MVKSFRSKNLGYVYSSPHGFFYDQGKGDVRSMLKYAGDELTHVLFADTFNQTLDCRYIANPPLAERPGEGGCHHPPAPDDGRGRRGLPRHLRDPAGDGLRQ